MWIINTFIIEDLTNIDFLINHIQLCEKVTHFISKEAEKKAWKWNSLQRIITYFWHFTFGSKTDLLRVEVMY